MICCFSLSYDNELIIFEIQLDCVGVSSREIVIAISYFFMTF